jgi:crossover junction endodeoxyribonuclease RuvC
VIEKKGQMTTALAYGHISTSKNLSLSKRLLEISDDLSEIIRKYQPEEAAVEELFFYNNQKTVISVAEARGCILLTIERFSIIVAGYTPLEVKQAITNSGRADKKQVQEMVTRILKLSTIPKPDDTADALALALCHAARRATDNAKNLPQVSHK